MPTARRDPQSRRAIADGAIEDMPLSTVRVVALGRRILHGSRPAPSASFFSTPRVWMKKLRYDRFMRYLHVVGWELLLPAKRRSLRRPLQRELLPRAIELPLWLRRHGRSCNRSQACRSARFCTIGLTAAVAPDLQHIRRSRRRGHRRSARSTSPPTYHGNLYPFTQSLNSANALRSSAGTIPPWSTTIHQRQVFVLLPVHIEIARSTLPHRSHSSAFCAAVNKIRGHAAYLLTSSCKIRRCCADQLDPLGVCRAFYRTTSLNRRQ